MTVIIPVLKDTQVGQGDEKLIHFLRLELRLNNDSIDEMLIEFRLQDSRKYSVRMNKKTRRSNSLQLRRPKRVSLHHLIMIKLSDLIVMEKYNSRRVHVKNKEMNQDISQIDDLDVNVQAQGQLTFLQENSSLLMRKGLDSKQSHLRLGRGPRTQTSLFKWRLNEAEQVIDLTTRRHRIRHPMTAHARLRVDRDSTDWLEVPIKVKVLAVVLTILLLTLNVLPALLDYFDLVPPHEFQLQNYQSSL